MKQMTAKQQEFINKILPGAIKSQKEIGLFASITLAQSILESSWGRASIGFNVFGVKATSSWKGLKKLVKTAEFVGGKKIFIEAYFRDYLSYDESIADHSKLLTYPRYKAVLSAKDYKEAAVQIQKCGYATDPKYAAKLIALIESLGLDKWDTKKTSAPVVIPEKPTPPSITSPNNAVPPKAHVVKSGDTLSKIAKLNDTTVSALVKINGIKDPNFIFVGQIIKLK